MILFIKEYIMSQNEGFSHQDLKPVILRKKKTSADKVKTGEITKTVRHDGPNSNKKHVNARKLEEEDIQPIEKVSHDVSVQILQARNAKGMSQKDLATKLNVKPVVIQEYESGKAIPDGALLAKISTALGTKITNPKKGKKK